jgi:hypothetical protein
MTDRPDSFTDNYIRPGTPVRYDGGDGPEFGVVVHCWSDPDAGFFDCYVAFFGKSIQLGRPEERPYVLRYASRLRTH